MQAESSEKQRLQEIVKISKAIYYSTYAPEFISAEISDLGNLTAYFEYMTLERRMMRHHYQRACDLKQKAKKDEEWRKALGYVKKLNGQASQILARDFKD